MRTITAEECREIKRKEYEKWALKQGVDVTKSVSLDDAMKLAVRRAAEREVISEVERDDGRDVTEELFALRAEDIELRLKSAIEIVNENYVDLYIFLQFLLDLDHYGYFLQDQIDFEWCTDELEWRKELENENDEDGEDVMVLYD